ncbi:hypothetical protein EYF80_019649 [Liparis tanakae]|uniref:Uncharacterized protein n=1 Tax=Liparis tanakae TaxID=230148 RepID=A0A4Z2HWU2_9TELE|nr:hypothetical protein EYF80_019649 [Liparis tanakae]
MACRREGKGSGMCASGENGNPPECAHLGEERNTHFHHTEQMQRAADSIPRSFLNPPAWRKQMETNNILCAGGDVTAGCREGVWVEAPRSSAL